MSLDPRAMEAIARDLMPEGSEKLPLELTRLEELIDSNDKQLMKFFERRVKSIFSKPNSLGYGIDLAKKIFPYPGVNTLDKNSVVRLRGIEAHARVHSYTSAQAEQMHSYGMQLDFLCRACLLLSLGMPHEQIVAGLPKSRFSWVLETDDSEPGFQSPHKI